jgi:copper chaperone NosL
MTIVDKQHASQLVTEKGKVYKFDAIECMVDHLSEDTTPIALYLVTDYTHPEELIDAKKATFIISANIPSPMKANLSALASKSKAEELQESKGGELYTWETLLAHLNKE